jgi:hypothetical protein
MQSNSAYNQGLLDGGDSRPVASWRWFNAALIGGIPLLLFVIVATSFSAPAVPNTGANEATSLVGLSPLMPGTATRQMGSSSLRAGAYYSRTTQAMQDSLKTYGIGSSPLEKLALTAIDASNRDNRASGRPDFSVQARAPQAARAEMVSGWSTVDSETKRKLIKVLDQVKAKESLLAGITAPLGFFDPLGFSTTLTGKGAGAKLLFYREVELKHGRVAMLASLGMLLGEQFHPLFGGDIDVPSYIAFQQTPLENFWPAVVTAIAIPEIFSVFQFQDPASGEQWAMKEDHEPGNLGFDPLGLKPTDPKAFKEMQTKELNNGRLAMIAAAGMIAQEMATGEKLFGN